MVRPIVFLDCDGVIMTLGTMSAATLFTPEARLATRFRNFCEEFDAIVIVSSSWRNFFNRPEFIANVGLWLESRIPNDRSWCTPSSLHGTRGDEIETWLAQHSQIENHPHVIFDDDADFHPHQPLVHCDHMIGLSEENLTQARQILQTPIQEQE